MYASSFEISNYLEEYFAAISWTINPHSETFQYLKTQTKSNLISLKSGNNGIHN